jgi:hypothetical protein
MSAKDFCDGLARRENLWPYELTEILLAAPWPLSAPGQDAAGPAPAQQESKPSSKIPFDTLVDLYSRAFAAALLAHKNPFTAYPCPVHLRRTTKLATVLRIGLYIDAPILVQWYFLNALSPTGIGDRVPDLSWVAFRRSVKARGQQLAAQLMFLSLLQGRDPATLPRVLRRLWQALVD